MCTFYCTYKWLFPPPGLGPRSFFIGKSDNVTSTTGRSIHQFILAHNWEEMGRKKKRGKKRSMRGGKIKKKDAGIRGK